MKKKVFAVFMIVAMLLCFMPSMAFAHNGGNGTTATPDSSAGQIGDYYAVNDETGALTAKPTLESGKTQQSYADGQVLGKPRDERHAFDMIKSLSGGSHSVYTGVTFICGKEKTSFYEQTEVYVYDMTDEEILDYIKTKEPMDKAGAYGIQGRFAAFVSKIEGDYNSVVGLPVGRVYQELRKAGYIG